MRILLIDIDTLRADHVGAYGYHRNTTPCIDAVANEGVRFNHYYTSDAPCLPSRTALMSGRFGIHTGVVNHGGTAANFRLEGSGRDFQDTLMRQSLPGYLRGRGIRTVSISPFGERHAAWHFYAGFSEMHNTGRCGVESAEEITPIALQWFDEHGREDNWFLHVNYWDPHTPYRAPAGFGNPFADEPLPAWITEQVLQQHRNMVGPHKPHELNMYDARTKPEFPRQPGQIRDMAELRDVFDGYDCGIRYVDGHVGQLLDKLKSQGVWDDLAIIITADHGENMGEFGIYAEHTTADVSTCRLPMIVRYPGCKLGHVDNGLHYALDLAPTLAELLGGEPAPSWDGQGYVRAVTSGEDEGRDYLVISQCSHVCQRSVRMGRWLYMRTYHDGYHLLPPELLFDIEQDPYQQYDLSRQHRDVCMQAVYLLNEWHDRMMSSMDYDVDPLWTVMREGGPFHARGHLAKYCEYLKQTGREWAIPELTRRHPNEFQ